MAKLSASQLENLLAKLANTEVSRKDNEDLGKAEIEYIYDKENYKFKIIAVSDEEDSAENPDYKDLASKHRSITVVPINKDGEQVDVKIKEKIFKRKDDVEDKHTLIWEKAEKVFEGEDNIFLIGTEAIKIKTKDAFRIPNTRGDKKGWAKRQDKSEMTLTSSPFMLVFASEDAQTKARNWIRRIDQTKAWVNVGADE